MNKFFNLTILILAFGYVELTLASFCNLKSFEKEKINEAKLKINALDKLLEHKPGKLLSKSEKDSLGNLFIYQVL